MSAPGESCVRCGSTIIDEGYTIRCTTCGFRAYHGGSVLDIGGRIKVRTLTCPMCGGHASADQFEEFKPKNPDDELYEITPKGREEYQRQKKELEEASQ